MMICLYGDSWARLSGTRLIRANKITCSLNTSISIFFTMMIGSYRSMSNIIMDISEDKELDVEFSYSVLCKKTDISFKERTLIICFLLDYLIAYWTNEDGDICTGVGLWFEGRSRRNLSLVQDLILYGLSIGIAFREVLHSSVFGTLCGLPCQFLVLLWHVWSLPLALTTIFFTHLEFFSKFSYIGLSWMQKHFQAWNFDCSFRADQVCSKAANTSRSITDISRQIGWPDPSSTHQ